MYNNSTRIDCWRIQHIPKSLTLFYFQLISLISMNSLVIFGNLLVALAPFLNRRLRNPGHYFIASLAWADFALGIFVIPLAISIQMNGGVWSYGAYTCQIWQTIDVIFCTGSIYSLIAITFDRFVAVTKPLVYKSWMTTKTCCFLIFGVWLGSLIVAVPSVFLSWSRNANLVNTACRCTPAANRSFYIVYSSVASFFLPMLIILYFYAHIYVKVRKIRLNSNRGIVNIGGRLPTTVVSSINNNTEIQSVFPDSSTITGSTGDIQHKKSFLLAISRHSSRKKTSNCRPDQKLKICEDFSSMSPSGTPQERRRSSEGPVLRIHKGKYHARQKLAGTVEMVPLMKKKCDLSQIDGSMKNHSENEPMKIPKGGGGMSRLLLQAMSNLGTSPTPTPSLSELTLANSAMHDYSSLSRRTSINEKCRKRNDENEKMPNDVWLRFALPSQLVSAWAQRMLALQRYRRKVSLELRALKTVVMVTGCFFICWTGFCVVYTMQAWPTCRGACVTDWIFDLFVWMGYANSAANPIVYGAMNAQFRRTFRRIIGKVTRARFV